VFRRAGSGWCESHEILGEDAQDFFGSSVSLDVTTAAIGALGANGSPVDTFGPGAGYIYDPETDAPWACHDYVTTDEDVPVTIDALANDGDPNADTLTIDSVT
jgi:hypothetical protein